MNSEDRQKMEDEKRATGDAPDVAPMNGRTATSAAAAPAGAARSPLGESVRRNKPVLLDFGIDFGNWLASISWGKFTLLSILLLIFGALASTIIFSSIPEESRGRDSGSVDVNVHVVPLQDGTVLIDPAPPARTARHASASAKAPHKDDGVILQVDGDGGENAPAVRIDKQGVRVLADDSGHKVSVVIDHNGVRVEKLPGEADAPLPDAPPPPVPPKAARETRPVAPPPAPPAAPEANLILGAHVLLPAVGTDPEKIAAAVEAARGAIEGVVQDQVDSQLDAWSRGDRMERTDWVELLVVMAIVAMIALKVVLGSKSRAEFQARRASATAAQEGLKRQLAEAQLKMMQAQVEPHFLFNTLASVDYLIETDPARASRMQKNLILYLRAAVPQMRQGTSTLGREILQCRSYLEILKVRMDERLQFSINVPQGLLSADFPPMMLLTLVENAIKHGLEPKADGGTLSVSAVVADGRLRVAVADSGMGFGNAQRGGTGVGLANVRERLQALYGTGASLSIDANSDGGTIATILVPYRIESAAGVTPGDFPAPAPAV